MPEILHQADLTSYNTFGIHAVADSLIIVFSADEVERLLSMKALKALPKLILGGGSNVLFTGDYGGLVIVNRIQGISVVGENDQYVLAKAGSGVNWHEFVSYTVNHGWGGLENLSLIPGTVGAAPIQNIGAYGVEIKDTFHELEAIDLSSGQRLTFSRAECEFGYRDSFFKRSGKGKFMILSVTFRLSKQPVLNTKYGAIEEELAKLGINAPTIKDVSNAVIAIRSSKLPDPAKIGNAGSFFKNPEVPDEQFAGLKKQFPELPGYPASSGHTKLAAGFLIEQCGWKGRVVGNTGMHAKQALVLVNHGNATGAELLQHARNVQKSVKEKFDVELEMEVNLVPGF